MQDRPPWIAISQGLASRFYVLLRIAESSPQEDNGDGFQKEHHIHSEGNRPVAAPGENPARPALVHHPELDFVAQQTSDLIAVVEPSRCRSISTVLRRGETPTLFKKGVHHVWTVNSSKGQYQDAT